MRIYTIFLLLQFTLLSGVTVFAQQKKSDEAFAGDIRKVAQRLTDDYLSVHVDDDQVEQLVTSIKADGSWPYIDYVTVGNDFPAENHLKNLRTMAIAYAKPGTDFYHSEKLKQKILSGYRYYLDKNPISLNWWYNDIGAPQIYMIGLLLMKDHLKIEEINYYSSYLRDLTDNQSHQGMNRIWVSAITIHKGCIETNYALVNKGFKSVASTLVIAHEQGAEGIKIDNSFHQHRPQLYSGGYGMAFAEITANLMALSANTSFGSLFSSDKRKLFSDLLLNGHQLFGFRKAIDFGTIGRNIARPDAINNISPDILDKMVSIDVLRASSYLDWKAHLHGADFPESFIGNKYFWKSDIMTQHGKDYYMSAKVISTRTNGTEMLNGENLKGYNLPLGATNIMTTGEEYKNIFPVWDWTRVPGTTAVMSQAATVLPWYLFGTNEFAGGVSDGKTGAIAYEHSYNGVQAKKAYFFADGQILCLGAGISAIRTQQVVTSVNQCYSNGKIRVGGKNEAEEFTLVDSLRLFKGSDMRWVYHNGVGYIFPMGGSITLKNVVQTGSWKLINTGGSDEIISKPVFSLWLSHGTAPKDDSYCYIISPNNSLEHFKKKVLSQDFSVLINNKKIQAVKYKDNYFIVFYERGTANLGNGLNINSNGKTMVMLEQNDHSFQLSVSDPTHQQSDIKISINRKLKGKDVSYPKGGITEINFNLPIGDYKGSTISRFYEN